MEHYLLLVVGLIILIAGAEALVRGASEIALKLRISRLVVGLTIVAFGTSAPELFISLKSALLEHPEIAIGNVVGSNICNITLVLGLTAFIFPIKVTAEALKVNWTVAMGVTILFFLLVIDRQVDWWEGAIFVVMIAAYNYYLIKGSRNGTADDSDEEDEANKPFGPKQWAFNLALIVIGSVGLVYGSDFLLDGATEIASDLFPGENGKRLIGITIVAFGTSLPELATSVVSAIRHKADLGLGNLIGSNIFNILSILGITALVTEIPVADLFVQHDLIWVMLITALLFPVMLTRMRISRWEGLLLLLMYATYMYSLNSEPHLFQINWL